MDGQNLEWGTRHLNQAVWVKDDSWAWKPGTIVQVNDEESEMVIKSAVVGNENEETKRISIDKNGKIKGKDLVLPRDVGPKCEGLDNMDDLTHLHEASILHNVCTRFESKKIYTRTGPILVAMNPFEWLPIYGPEQVNAYRYSSKTSLDEMKPHCFAEAEKAYRSLSSNNSSHSLIICGESGSGKTETTKLMLQYLSANYTETSDNGIAERIMKSNPVMEAFGNAKTLRNKNSSRFGKFIKLDFNDKQVHGAHIANYLLEKSRTVRQNPGERNYHVFYQLCKGASPKRKEQLGIADKTLRDFNYLNQSGCVEVIGVDDSVDFQETLKAMNSVGIETEEADAVFRIVASILHLGNAAFRKRDSTRQRSSSVEETKEEISDIINNDDALGAACHLLKCDAQQLGHALRVKYIKVNDKAIESPLDHAKAADLRDALSKSIYQQLFTYIVDRINESLENPASTYKTFIGILDIYGFESFKENGFEQLLINFANEKLQSLFNEMVFLAEEKTYNAEQVPFSRTDIPNNDQCLSLVDGIFKLMHDECLRMNAGSDKSLASQISQRYKNEQHFGICGPGSKRKGTSDLDFSIKHYAGDIIYTCNAFIDKNRDTLYPHVREILAESSCSLVKQLFPLKQNEQGTKRSGKLQETVAKRFSNQVHALTETIKTTSPMFVRCIKTNNDLLPNKTERISILRQLKNAGVVAALEMRRAGYPNRLPYKDFVLRCRALLPRDAKVGDDYWRPLAESLVKNPLLQSECKGLVAFGKTKLFLRANVLHAIDGVVQQQITQYVITVQSIVRQYLSFRRHAMKRKCAVFCQAHFRGYRDRKRLEEQIKALEAKREWFSRAGRVERLAKSLRESSAVAIQLGEACVSDYHDSDLGLESLVSQVEAAQQVLENAKSILNQAADIPAMDSCLKELENLVNAANQKSNDALSNQQKIAGQAVELEKTLASVTLRLEELNDQEQIDKVFLSNDHLGDEKSCTFLLDQVHDEGNLDSEGGEETRDQQESVVDLIERFAKGYKSAKETILQQIVVARQSLSMYNLKQAREQVHKAQETMDLALRLLQNAVASKHEIDEQLVCLEEKTTLAKSRLCKLLQLASEKYQVARIEEIDMSIAKASASTRELLLLMNGQNEEIADALLCEISEKAQYYETDSESDAEFDSGKNADSETKRGASRGYIDIAQVESVYNQTIYAIQKAEELLGRGNILYEDRMDAIGKVRMARKNSLDILDETKQIQASELDAIEQHVLFNSSSVQKAWSSAETWIARAKTACSKQIQTFDDKTALLTEEIRYCAEETLKQAEKARTETNKVRTKLDTVIAAQNTARERLLPGLDELSKLRTLVAKKGLCSNHEIKKAISCVEIEFDQVKSMLSFTPESKVPSSKYVEKISQHVESTLQILSTANELVQEEMKQQQEDHVQVINARAQVAVCSSKLGELLAKIDLEPVFIPRNIRSLCNASSCGAQVCDKANAVVKTIQKIENLLGRASRKVAKIDSMQLAKEDEQDALEKRRWVSELRSCAAQAKTSIVEAEKLLTETIQLRSEELKVLEDHVVKADQLLQNLYRLEQLQDTVGTFSNTEKLFSHARSVVLRYVKATRILTRCDDDDDDERNDQIDKECEQAGSILSERDSIDVLLFVKRNSLQVLGDCCFEATKVIEDLDQVVKAEQSYLAQAERSRVENERRHIEKKRAKESEEQAIAQQMSSVRDEALLKLRPARALVATLSQVCQFCEERLEGQVFGVESASTLRQLIHVQHCLTMVEKSLCNRDPSHAMEQIRIAVSEGKYLESLVFGQESATTTEYTMEQEQKEEENQDVGLTLEKKNSNKNNKEKTKNQGRIVLMNSKLIRDLVNQDPEQAKKASLSLNRSGKTLTDIQQVLGVEGSRLRAVKAQVDLYAFESGKNAELAEKMSLYNFLEEAQSAVDCAASKLEALCAYPSTTFVALQCLGPSSMNESAQQLADQIKSLISTIDLVHTCVQRCAVGLERCKRYKIRSKKQDARVRRLVVKYVCPRHNEI